MAKPKPELDRPHEWLRGLAEEPEGYRVLLHEAGGLAHAAYRVASARCRAQGGIGEAPTLRELQSAAMSIARHTGRLETLPITSLLAGECEEQGLKVIQPMPTPPSSRKASILSLRRAS